MSEYEKMKANKVPFILSIVLYEENVHVNKIDHLFIIIHDCITSRYKISTS